MWATTLLLSTIAATPRPAATASPQLMSLRTPAVHEPGPEATEPGQVFVPAFLRSALDAALLSSPSAQSLWRLVLASRVYIRVVPQRQVATGMSSDIHLTPSGKLIQTIRYPRRMETWGKAGNLALLAGLFHELAHGLEIVTLGQATLLDGPNRTDAREILRSLIAQGNARPSGFHRHETLFAVASEARIVAELQHRRLGPASETGKDPQAGASPQERLARRAGRRAALSQSGRVRDSAALENAAHFSANRSSPST